MRGSHYTEEQNAFIAENYLLMTYPQLTENYNKKFGSQMTVSAMQKKIGYMKLPKKPREYQSRFTKEADEYLMANWKLQTSNDLTKSLYEMFDIKVRPSTINERLRNLGVQRGSCYVPVGYLPKASKPVGTERVDKGRTIMVKVAQPDVWKPKAQLVMGYDPKESQAIFLDGNSLNVTPENIVVVSKKVHARLAKNGWLNSSNEILMAGIKWSELHYALKEMEETINEQPKAR